MKLQGLIFDWAGTAVDFGSQCPVLAFQQAFAQHGVELEAWAIHRFMGARKREHLLSMLALPEVAQQWLTKYGAAPTDADVDSLYRATETLMVELAPQYAQPVPGLIDALRVIRARGLKLGSTTGYTKCIMEALTRAAAAHGYTPDCWVAADQVSAGRPWPWMVFANLERLNLCPPSAVIKVGDTLVDIDEGLNAGTWTVGVVQSSSLMGLSEADWQATPPDVRAEKTAAVRAKFTACGAHYIIDSLAGLEPVLDQIQLRAEAGECPPPKGSAQSIVL